MASPRAASSSVRNRPVPIDPDALYFALPIFILAVVGLVWGFHWLWPLMVVALLAVLGFFRDPPRRVPVEAGAIVSPADGKIVAIEPNADSNRGPVPGRKIAIFLSVLDVHVNRAPCAGVIERISYVKGRYLDARNPQSGEANESNWIFIRSGDHRITVRQIAGLIARRIVCRVREGQELAPGERIGLIRFGSRVELYVPFAVELKVKVGDRVAGGSTLIAVLKENRSDPLMTQVFRPE